MVGRGGVGVLGSCHVLGARVSFGAAMPQTEVVAYLKEERHVAAFQQLLPALVAAVGQALAEANWGAAERSVQAFIGLAEVWAGGLMAVVPRGCVIHFAVIPGPGMMMMIFESGKVTPVCSIASPDPCKRTPGMLLCVLPF